MVHLDVHLRCRSSETHKLTLVFVGPPTVLSLWGGAQNKLCHLCPFFSLKQKQSVDYSLTHYLNALIKHLKVPTCQI